MRGWRRDLRGIGMDLECNDAVVRDLGILFNVVDRLHAIEP